jgi:SPP1 family predicted phage head-tail adaptor
MQIGSRDRQITIQYQTKTPDGLGGFAVVWNDLETVWAKKTTHRSDEAVQAMATTGITIHNFNIVYRNGITKAMRIKDGNKYLNIIGIIEINRGIGGHEIDLTVKEAA